jgi:hypothetical protein
MPSSNRARFESVAGQLAAGLARAKSDPPAAQGLHVCLGCDSKLVYPIAWAGASGQTLTLRCPECELIAVGEFEQSAIDALELELERGEAELRVDLSTVTRANMVDTLGRFVRALEAGAIQPIDF